MWSGMFPGRKLETASLAFVFAQQGSKCHASLWRQVNDPRTSSTHMNGAQHGQCSKHSP